MSEILQLSSETIIFKYFAVRRQKFESGSEQEENAVFLIIRLVLDANFWLLHQVLQWVIKQNNAWRAA